MVRICVLGQPPLQLELGIKHPAGGTVVDVLRVDADLLNDLDGHGFEKSRLVDAVEDFGGGSGLWRVVTWRLVEQPQPGQNHVNRILLHIEVLHVKGSSLVDDVCQLINRLLPQIFLMDDEYVLVDFHLQLLGLNRDSFQ